MTYTVDHNYVDQKLNVFVTRQDELATVRCSASGSLPIRFPGTFRIFAVANYYVRHYSDGAHGGWTVQTRSLPLTVQIKTPDGQPFAAEHVTLNDLARFRDLRGTSQGSWTFTVSGHSEPILVEPNESEVTPGDGHLIIALEETVTSHSAPPLVHEEVDAHAHYRYTFDLWRIGTFVARAQGRFPIVMRKVLKLFDPDGIEVATSAHGDLQFAVTLEALDKSRDAHGQVRPWSLEVFPSLPTISGAQTIWASVIATSRIRTHTLQSRI
jgi:hypothetical protein